MRKVGQSLGMYTVGSLVVAVLLLQTALAWGVESAKPPQSGYVIPETERWEISTDTGEVYWIFVSLPKGPPPEHGHPVLYVLDGNAIFGGFAEARRLLAGAKDNPFARPDIGSAIIIGVGYPTKQLYDARRLYDFTAPFPENVPSERAVFKEHPSGGNNRFLEFLVKRLRPEVASRYSINPHRQALFGHSLGGLFALHVLYTHPDAFEAIIAASPSIFWNEKQILAEEHEFARQLSTSKLQLPPSRTLLLAGEREEYFEELWDAEALAKRLEPLSAFGLRSRFEILDDESHITVPSRAITTTLRFAFGQP